MSVVKMGRLENLRGSYSRDGKAQCPKKFGYCELRSDTTANVTPGWGEVLNEDERTKDKDTATTLRPQNRILHYFDKIRFE